MKVFLVLLPVAALAAGGSAGYLLSPADPSQTGTPSGSDANGSALRGSNLAEGETSEFVNFSNQFVVPLVADDDVDAVMIMSLSVEIAPGRSEDIYAVEPKLRDSLLQILFDHASVGGFSGNFLSGAKLHELKLAMAEVARETAGPAVRGVLIVDLVKQML